MSASEPVPAWLSAWRERHGAPVVAPELKPLPTPVKRLQRTAQPRRTGTYGFIEPTIWPYDSGVRREAVLDTNHNPPRLIRRVGWHKCLRCKRPFFSEDVIRLRLCDGLYGCRADAGRYVV
jgi:hypothetical protein